MFWKKGWSLQFKKVLVERQDLLRFNSAIVFRGQFWNALTKEGVWKGVSKLGLLAQAFGEVIKCTSSRLLLNMKYRSLLDLIILWFVPLVFILLNNISWDVIEFLLTIADSDSTSSSYDCKAPSTPDVGGDCSSGVPGLTSSSSSLGELEDSRSIGMGVASLYSYSTTCEETMKVKSMSDIKQLWILSQAYSSTSGETKNKLYLNCFRCRHSWRH